MTNPPYPGTTMPGYGRHCAEQPEPLRARGRHRADDRVTVPTNSTETIRISNEGFIGKISDGQQALG